MNIIVITILISLMLIDLSYQHPAYKFDKEMIKKISLIDIPVPGPG